MDKILHQDYQRALRSNHPRFIQEVIFRLMRVEADKIDELAEKVYYLTEGFLHKPTAQEKIDKLFRVRPPLGR